MIRDFAFNFFHSCGANIVEDHGIMTIQLPAQLSAYFEKETLKLHFDSDMLCEDSELVTRGSFIFDKICRYLTQEGEKIYFQYRPQRTFDTKERDRFIARQFTFINCAPYGFKSRRLPQREVLFNFKIRYLSDEKHEQLLSFRVSEDGDVQLLPALANVPEQITTLSKKPLNAFSTKEIQSFFSLCISKIHQLALQEAEKYEQAIQSRLLQNVDRIRRYYHQLIEDLTPESERNYTQYKKQIAHLEQEFRHKLTEEIDNHRLQVEIKLISYAMALIPSLRTKMFLDKQRKTQLSFVLNLHNGEAYIPSCPVCMQKFTSVVVCKAHHVVCSNCYDICSRCQQVFCNHCPLDRCAHCNDLFCKQCVLECPICGQNGCLDFKQTCSFCDRDVCLNCHLNCSICARGVCAEHQKICNVCEKGVCTPCASTCIRCQKAFCTAHAGDCQICGQILCMKCTTQCYHCGKSICSAHSKPCQDCSNVCCENDIISCLTCERFFCRDHIFACKRCSNRLCQKDLCICNHCGKPCCFDDISVCQVCQENTCGDCLNLGICGLCRNLFEGKGISQTPELLEIRKRGLIDKTSTLKWTHLSGHDREFFMGENSKRLSFKFLITDKELNVIRFLSLNRRIFMKGK